MEAGESFVNYSSIEDSPYGLEVLEELVSKGFVMKLSDEAEVRSKMGGQLPILSKLALITTIKDGVLKHRLILDCRVSGVSDAAIKVERILLPSAWGAIHDTLAMHAKVIPSAGEILSNTLCATSRTRSSCDRFRGKNAYIVVLGIRDHGTFGSAYLRGASMGHQSMGACRR